jgi:hypothetical protein
MTQIRRPRELQFVERRRGRHVHVEGRSLCVGTHAREGTERERETEEASTRVTHLAKVEDSVGDEKLGFVARMLAQPRVSTSHGGGAATLVSCSVADTR